MDNLTFGKIKEAIDKYNTIAIAVPNNPNVDQMAAALSLYFSLLNTGKNVTVATPSNPLVEVSNLVGIDRVRTTFGGEDGDLIVSFPYREGEIEKVSYTRDDNFLNIVVKAGELGLNFDESDVKFTRGGGSPELLFVIGASRVSDLGTLFDPEALKDTVIVNIDNKADNQGYGDILMVSTRLSSVSEAVANLIIALGYKLDPDIAQNLMTGISSATENFQNPQTSALAFEMAGILMRSGAVRAGDSQRRRMAGSDEFIKAQENLLRNQDARTQDLRSQDQAPRVQDQDVKPQEVERKENIKDPNPPEDWLEPKIYKGSTSF